MGPHYQNFSRPLPAHTPPPHVDTNKYNDIEFQALSYESFPLSGPPPKMQEITVPRIGFRPLDGVVLFSLLIAISLIIVIWGECFASIGLNANAGQTCVLKWKIGGLRPIILVGAHTQHPMTELYWPLLQLALTALIYTWSCKKDSNRYLNCNSILWPLYTVSIVFVDVFWFTLFKDWERFPKAKDTMLATIIFEGIAAWVSQLMTLSSCWHVLRFLGFIGSLDRFFNITK